MGPWSSAHPEPWGSVLSPGVCREGCSELSVQTSTEQGKRPWSLPQEFLVEKEDEEVDVDLGLVEEFHNSYTFILELQEVLGRGHWGAGVRAPGGGPVSGKLSAWSLPRPRSGPDHRDPTSQSRTPRAREDSDLTKCELKHKGLKSVFLFKRPKSGAPEWFSP